jgi:uncharacterized coiled-coil protein SlyX
MNLIDVALTEINYILKQGLTTIIILIYPWIVIAILSQAFISMEFEEVKIIIYAQNPSDLEGIKGLIPGNIKFLEVGSEEEVIESVRAGNATIGITITRDKDGRVNLMFYQDPLKGAISSELVARIENAFGEESRSYIENRVVSLWYEMSNVSEQLKEETSKIPEFREKLKNITNQLNDLERKIEQANIQEMSQSIGEAEKELYSTDVELNSLSTKIENLQQSVNRIDSYINDLNEFDRVLAEKREQLINARSGIYNWRQKNQYSFLMNR